jgi:hypothetical protein
MMGRIARDVDRWAIVGAAAALLLATFVPGPISILAGIVAGSLVSIAASQYYSKQASRELRNEAATLRRETAKLREEAAKHKDTTLIMRALEEGGGEVEFARDDQGKIAGLVVKGSAALGGRGSMSAESTVVHHEQPDEDRD